MNQIVIRMRSVALFFTVLFALVIATPSIICLQEDAKAVLFIMDEEKKTGSLDEEEKKSKKDSLTSNEIFHFTFWTENPFISLPVSIKPYPYLENSSPPPNYS